MAPTHPEVIRSSAASYLSYLDALIASAQLAEFGDVAARALRDSVQNLSDPRPHPLTEIVALSTSANLIGVDLHRNVNQIAIERRPEDVARWAAFIESLEAPAEPEPDPTTSIWEPAAYRPAVTRVGVGRAAR